MQSPFFQDQGTCGDPLSLSKAVLIPSDQIAPSMDLSGAIDSSSINSIFAASLYANGRYVACPESEAPAPEQAAGEPLPGQEASKSHPSSGSLPIRLPPFAQQMMVNLPLEFLTNPVRIVQGFVVRTWYLHHVNIPLSLQARQLMLTGPPHLWRAQILTAWADFLIPAEDITLDLVSPNPPRNWHETNIVFDLILAQGMYCGRFSGLVSVSPTLTEPNLRMYAVAISLEPIISGQDIITSADIQPLCNRFDCLVFFSRTQLYIDFNRVHHMQHGHGFVVYLSRRPCDEPAVNPLTIVPASSDPHPEPQNEVDMEVDPPHVDSTDPLATEPTSAAPADESELKRVTLYRLHRTPKFAWVRWKHFATLMQDILEVTDISPVDLVAIHPVLAKPIGETPQELSVILQQRHDIELGSSDCLVLLDVVFHQQGSIAHMYAPPVIDRKVVRVPLHLTRSGMLHVARVANYCESVGHTCLVMINHQLWPAQAAGTQTIASGCYVRVQVPPARVYGAETCRSASLVEDLLDSTLPSFDQVYPALPHHTDVNSRTPPAQSTPAEAMHDCVRGCQLALPKQCHYADQHVAGDPSFETDIPTQAAPVFPNAPGWHEFDLEMRAHFDELSVIDIPEEGPVLHVTTWFIHHDHAPVCLVGRLIRLSQRPFDWFAQLCTPWLHLIRPFQNVAFHIVRPTPVSDIPGLRMLHVILEQGIQQSRMTALFSAIFQGMHGDITHRRAQSIPTVLSQEIITRILDVQSLCRARRCIAWSGRAQFQRIQTDPVYNGIGICLTVDAFRNRFAAVDDDGFPLPPSASSSTLPTRMSFRADDATLFPTAEQARSSTDSRPDEHVPSNLVPELKIIWQNFLMATPQGPYRFYVETWFCDHDRFPRTNRGREVLLSPDHETWRDTILAAWHDMIDPSVEVLLYVVQPQPIGGPTEVLAHILIAQHQHRGFVSALITTIAPGDDIWDPPRVALKLPAVVDKGLLIHESGLFMFCPPFMPFNTCRASLGDCEISQDVLHPASSGHGFLCTANSEAAVHIDSTFGSAVIQDVHKLFGVLGHVITKLTASVVHALNHSRGEVAADVSLVPQIPEALTVHSSPATSRQYHDISETMHWTDDSLRQEQLSSPVLSAGQDFPDSSQAVFNSDDGTDDASLRQQLQFLTGNFTSPVHTALPFAEAQRGPHPAPNTDVHSRVTLCLDACIAKPACYQTDGFVGAEITYRSREDWPAFLAQTFVQLAPFPEGLQLTAESYHALICPCQVGELDLAGKLALYVDGSASQGAAAWSVVAVKYAQDGTPALCGTLSGLVEINQTVGQWVGADHADNISAELTAALVAMVFALCGDHYEEVVVRPDLTLSAKLASLAWRCQTHLPLGQLCQLLGSWFHKTGGSFVEVRGHSRHAWNDLADSLAKWTLATSQTVGVLDLSPFHELLVTGDISWAWLMTAQPTMHQCLPTGSVDGCWQMTPSYRKIDIPSADAQPSQWSALRFKVVSANVLALCEGAHDVPESAPVDRAVRLDLQWHAQKIAAVGLQESRRAEGKVCTDHYIGFASGAQICGKSPHYGCELWLHKHLAIDAEGRLTFSQFKAVVVLADPRRLVVNLSHPQLDISFVVLHVPCKSSSCSIEQLKTWWTETRTLLQQARLASLTWCMIDANAPLSSACTPFFQMHGAETTNAQGLLFEETLQQLQWYAPTTMSWAHHGSHGTWTHPRGVRLRRDYVVCSQAAFEWCSGTWVDDHFDGGFGHDDHYPVVMQCQGWLKDFQSGSRIQWDPLAFADPVKCHQFREAVKTLPIPDWSTHVDSHANIMEQNLLELARQHFQKTKHDRMRPRISEATRNYILFKRSCLDYGRANALMLDDSFREQLRTLEKEVRARVRHDQRDFYSQLVQDLATAGELHDSRHMYKLLTRLGGRKSAKADVKALPILKVQGVPVTSFIEQQKLWMKQFSAIEAGLIMARSEFHRQLPACLGIPHEDISLDDFPALPEIVQQIHRLKRGKAPGPNCLPPDVLKAGSHEIAQHLVALTTKIAAHGREPAAWRTGKLIPLHKGKLAKSDPAGYRSIFLNNFTTKIYHSVLRKHLVQAWSSILTHLQIGGRKGLGCDSAHHIIQAHVVHGQVSKQPSAILFVDFKSAFYSVLRQGLFQADLDATAFMAAMYRLKISPQQIENLLQHAQSEAAISNISPHAMRLLQDMLQATCFEMEGLNEVAVTTRGTRPGDPIGDVAFNIVMAVLLKDVTEFIRPSQATWKGAPDVVQDFTQVGSPATHAWAEVAYVDDLALMLRAPDNHQLLDLAHSAASAVFQAAHCRGLELTVGEGKTELLWSLHGEGKKKLQTQIANDHGSISIALPGHEQPLLLPVVLAYKHLGTWIQNDAKPLRAIRARLHAARQSWGPLVRPFLSKKGVLHRTKTQVFESLVTSRYLFNAHTWSLISPSQLFEWEAGLRPMLYALARPFLRGQPPFTLDVEILCGLCNLLAPSDMLHLARLRYFKRLLCSCPTVLWQLLHAVASHDGSWLAHLQDSFRWLSRFSGVRFALTGDTPLSEWCSFAALDSKWKGRLRRAMASCRRYRAENAKHAVWDLWLQNSLTRQGVASLASPLAVPLVTWQCQLCSEQFSSRRALAQHAVKKHEYVTLVKHFAYGSTCANCCRIFHHRIRLCCHLRTATECLARTRAVFPPLSAEALQLLSVEDRSHAKTMREQGWLATKAQVPVLRGCGPSLPPSGSPDAAVMFAKWAARTDTSPVHAFEALDGIRIGVDQDDSSQVEHDSPNDAKADMVFVMHSDSGAEHGHAGCFSNTGLAALYARLHIRTQCFIHFFSGFRRDGDLQSQIEMHWVQGIHHIFCISIDYCLQGSQSDLSSPKNLAFWKTQVCNGALLGVGGGPPAKHFPLLDSWQGVPPHYGRIQISVDCRRTPKNSGIKLPSVHLS